MPPRSTRPRNPDALADRQQHGLTIKEMAALAGITRQTAYSLLERRDGDRAMSVHKRPNGKFEEKRGGAPRPPSRHLHPEAAA
jgi:hypothetical protein